MARLSLHFDPAADPFGHLTLRTTRPRRADRLPRISRNAMIGFGFIIALTLAVTGLFIADQAAFNQSPFSAAASASLPLDYD